MQRDPNPESRIAPPKENKDSREAAKDCVQKRASPRTCWRAKRAEKQLPNFNGAFRFFAAPRLCGFT